MTETAAVPEPTYAEFKRHRPDGARGRARALYLSTAAAAATFTGRLERLLSRPRVQFLYLHHVLSDEDVAFDRLLVRLSRYSRFIRYSEAVDRIHRGEIDQPYVCFSFDDGLRDSLRAGRILKEHGTTACFFVCTGIVGEQDPERIRHFCRARLNFPVAAPFLSWDDIETLRSAGHEIGGHSMSHPDLGVIPEAQLDEEIGQTAEALRRRTGRAEHFAWPRGRWINFTPRARDKVFASGFRSCASAVRGCHVTRAPDPAQLCIRRDHLFARWPVSHVLYLMMRNARAASAASNDWPAEYATPPPQGGSACA